MSHQKTWKVSPPSGYMLRARSFAQAARILNQYHTTDSIPYLFCCGQATEVALKGFLVHKGVEEDSFKSRPGHNLVKAWAFAVERGAPISPTVPQWCELVNEQHTSPYYSRYPRSNRLMGLPDSAVTLDGIDKLIETILCEVKK